MPQTSVKLVDSVSVGIEAIYQVALGRCVDSDFTSVGSCLDGTGIYEIGLSVLGA